MGDRPLFLLHENFEAVARRVPDAVAVSSAGATVRYSELDRRADALARRLSVLGVGPEVAVGVRLGRGVDLVIALLAVLKAGGVYVPIEPRFPPARSAFMLARGGAHVLITTNEARDLGTVSDTVAHVVLLDHDDTGEAEQWRRPTLRGDNLAYITYTSGSTGEPKAVGTTHASASAYLRFLAEIGHVRPEDTALQLAPSSFDASIRDILGPLLAGARLVLLPDDQVSDVGRLLSTIASEAVTCLPSCVPSLLRTITGHGWPPRLPPSCVQRVMVSGEILTAKTVARVRECFGPGTLVVNHYGPTECTMTSTFHTVEPDGSDPIPIGHPPEWGSIYVLDARLIPVKRGKVGELFIGGVGVTRGYLGDPELTAGRFLPDPFAERPGARMYRTGDLGRVRADGHLEFRGRVDRQVKVNGVRVEPGEIEAVLERHPAVTEVAVTARSGPSGSTALTAYVVGMPDRPPDPAVLRSHARAALPEALVPKVFVDLPALPRTTTGKVDRRRLPAPVVSRLPGEPAPDGPRSAAEVAMLQVWRELLDRPTLGINDNLFDLGGDSLLAMALVYRIECRFGRAPTLADVFRAPTVAGLTRLLKGARQSAPVADPPGGELRRATRGDWLPLSFAQERLWFFENLLPGSPLNTIPAAFRVEGEVDRPALSAAVAEVVARHEALRLTFHAYCGEPISRIKAVGGGLRVVPVAPENDLDEEVTALVRRSMDITHGPLLDMTLFTGGAGTRLLIRLHHLVGDARSLELIVAELSAAYRARHEHRASGRPEPAIQYADYVEWQRSWLTTERDKRHLSFWQRELAGAPPLLDLPTDRSRPAVQHYRGETLYRPVPSDFVTAATALGRRESASLFMVLATVWATTLSRYSGQEDLVVGVPVAGRNRVEFEQIVGLFVNTLPIRVDVTGDPSFRTLLRRVRDAVLRAFAHLDFPFERLVEALKTERNLAYSPIFQTLVDLQNAATPDLPGARLSPVDVDSGTARFDISLSFVRRDTRITAVYTYNTDLFDVATARRLAGHIETLLAAAIAEPDRAVSALPLLTAAERHRLTPCSKRPSPTDRVVDLIAEHARWTPDRIAATVGEEHLSYADLMAAADRVARSLRARGVRRGSVVAVRMDRGLDLLVALIGIHRAGAAYLPLDPTHPPERLNYLVTQSGANPVLTDLDVTRSDGGLAVGRPQDLAYVIYTSGSTGAPKGVEVTQAGLTNVLLSLRHELSVTPDDTLVAVTTVSFDIAALELFLPLLAGGRVVIAPHAVAADPVRLRDLLNRSGATLLQATPATWQALVDLGPPHPTLRAALCGGEALPRRLAHDLFRLAGSVYNLYGPTETTIWSTAARLAPDDALVPIGEPIGDTRALVLDRRLEPVPPGVAGELYIGGAGVARGYRCRPGLTAERFLPDPYGPEPGGRLYRTGDRVRQRADGRLEYLSRFDRQIKLHGFRIEPGEVEHALLAHPAISQAIVTARPDPPPGGRLVAHVVAAGRVDTDQVRAFLADRLPAYLVPSVVLPVDALPLTANGKVDTRRLPDPGTGRPELSTAYASSRTEAERALSAIWANVLRLDRVGIDDDFFDLGGHSLLAIQVMARANEAFGTDLPLHAIFAAATVRRLALRVEDAIVQQVLAASDASYASGGVHRQRPLDDA